MKTLLTVPDETNHRLSGYNHHESARRAQRRIEEFLIPVLEAGGISTRLRIDRSDLEYPLPIHDPRWNSVANRLCSTSGGAGLLHRLHLSSDHRIGINVQPWVMYKGEINRPCFNIPSDADFRTTREALKALNIYQLTIILWGNKLHQFWFCKYADIPDKYWTTTYRMKKTKQDRIVFTSKIHERIPVGRNHFNLIMAIKKELRKKGDSYENQQAGVN